MPTFRVKVESGVELTTNEPVSMSYGSPNLVLYLSSSIRYSGHTLFYVDDCSKAVVPISSILTVHKKIERTDPNTGERQVTWDEVWARPQGETGEWINQAVAGFKRLFRAARQAPPTAEPQLEPVVTFDPSQRLAELERLTRPGQAIPAGRQSAVERTWGVDSLADLVRPPERR